MADIIKVEHLSYVYNPGMPNAVTALDDEVLSKLQLKSHRKSLR